MRNNQSNRIIRKLALIGMIAITLLVLISALTINKRVVPGNLMFLDDTGYTSYEIGWPVEFISYSKFLVIGTPTTDISNIILQNLLVDFAVFYSATLIIWEIYQKINTRKRTGK